MVAAAEVWKSATSVPVLENTQIVLAEALSEDSQHFQSKTTKIKKKCTFRTRGSKFNTLKQLDNVSKSSQYVSELDISETTDIRTKQLIISNIRIIQLAG